MRPTPKERANSGYRLVAKFTDNLLVRASTDGGVRSQLVGTAGADLSALTRLTQQYGARFSQLLKLTQADLTALEARAASNSGVAQPDLAGMVEVEVAAEHMQVVADALYASPLTEWVHFEEIAPPPPVCGDIGTKTNNYVGFQTHRATNSGVGVDAAWALGPARGAGVRVGDCEYSAHFDHEDLCGINVAPGLTPIGIYPDHGTAAMGVIAARDNGYGALGIAPDAEVHFFSEYTIEPGGNRVTALTRAVATFSAGDVVLLEMQSGDSAGKYVPAEIDPSLWTAVKMATDAGVIVVAAAGNGSANLDANSEYNARGDSGAIIVGAGSADTLHRRLEFSTYGSRVNVQGWGESVLTTGYGSYAKVDGDDKQSYGWFNGTSSASAMIAGVVTALQSYSVSLPAHKRLTPSMMRALLVQTGTPQQPGTGHIGPLPDMVAAMNAIKACGASGCPDLGDANGNGAVDAVDALVVSQHTVGTNSGPFFANAADVNCSGNVDVVDALLISQYSVGSITSFPCRR